MFPDLIYNHQNRKWIEERQSKIFSSCICTNRNCVIKMSKYSYDVRKSFKCISDGKDEIGAKVETAIASLCM